MYCIWKHFLLDFKMKFSGNIKFVIERQKKFQPQVIILLPLKKSKSGSFINTAVLLIWVIDNDEAVTATDADNIYLSTSTEPGTVLDSLH